MTCCGKKKSRGSEEGSRPVYSCVGDTNGERIVFGVSARCRIETHRIMKDLDAGNQVRLYQGEYDCLVSIGAPLFTTI